MEIVRELLRGCLLLKTKRFEDARGSLVKTFHADAFAALGVNFEIREEFYSTSKRGVIRGMHFQTPPHDHDKLVHCTRGAVLDVVLDIRRGSGYGQSASAELTDENCLLIFVPKGVAHGFLALTDDAQMHYKTITVQVCEAEHGIAWNSFGFNWGTDKPVVSARDNSNPSFGDFQSPFSGEEWS